MSTVPTDETRRAELSAELERLTVEIDKTDAVHVAKLGRSIIDTLREFVARDLLRFLSHTEVDTLLEYLLTRHELAKIAEESP